MIEKTYFSQENASINVSGTSWVSLYTNTTCTRHTEICGFKLTVSGTWNGSAKMRIVDRNESKMFPFQTEYVQGTDFYSDTQADFNFPVIIPKNDGYIFQVRSSNASDIDGNSSQLVTLDNLDIIGCDTTTLGAILTNTSNMITNISAVTTIGAGGLSSTWTQNTEDSEPMDNVAVWVTTDTNGSFVIAGTEYTNSSGVATFMLDAGTYYVWRQKGGYNFTNPQTWNVS